MSRHLQVFPELLEFPMRLGADTLLTASLRNASPSYLAFKVKTTATDRYRVRPNLGVVAPGETAHVKLVLVAQDAFGAQLSNCRDRFLVQSLPILPGQKPDGAAFRAQKFKVQDHKLRVSIMQVQGSALPVDTGLGSSEDRGGGSKHLNAVASPLEKEIRCSLMSIAEEQGADGHRSCLTKFSELLLLNGIISTQQMGVALDLVEILFDHDTEPAEVAERNRSVHTWLEESEHSGTHSESPPSHRIGSEASALVSTPPPGAGHRVTSSLATIQSGISASGLSASSSQATGGAKTRARLPRLLTPPVDPHTTSPLDLFPSPPDTPRAGDEAFDSNAAFETRHDGKDGMMIGTLPQRSPVLEQAPRLKNVDTEGGIDGYNGRPVALEDISGAAMREGAPGAPHPLPSGGHSDAANDGVFAPRGYPYNSWTSPNGGNIDGSGAHHRSPDSDNSPTTPPARRDGEGGVPDSPARDLAAMLRSTLRNSDSDGAALRDPLSHRGVRR